MKNKIEKRRMSFCKSRITRANQHLITLNVIFNVQRFDVKNQSEKRLNLNDKKNAFKRLVEKSDSRSVIILSKDFSFCYKILLITIQSKSEVLNLLYDCKEQNIIDFASID